LRARFASRDLAFEFLLARKNSLKRKANAVRVCSTVY
jgi:hypothetical protein